MTQAFNLSQLANRVNTSGQLDASTGLYNITPVANGGTGLSSAGTAGYVLTSTGSAFVMSAPSTGSNSGVLFTSGTPTWTAPVGVIKIRCMVIGGGGGGAGSSSSSAGGGRGGRGGYAMGYLTVVPGTTYSITVGAGGAGTNTTNANGSSGGSSAFSSVMSATGGQGGLINNTIGTDGVGSGGTYINSAIVDGSQIVNNLFPFSGQSARYNGASLTSGLAFSLPQSGTYIYLPGAAGAGETFDCGVGFNDATGGMGGIVYIEYIAY